VGKPAQPEGVCAAWRGLTLWAREGCAIAELDYDVVDVFADRAFAGNPLAVVRGAGDLSTRQLQALAREFNLSETAFPMTPTPAQAAAGATYRLRIFTPLAELPFAGHPSVGTAWVLARLGLLGAAATDPREPGGSGPAQAIQACAAGLVQVHAAPQGARISAASSGGGSAATAVPASDPKPALAAVALDASDLVDGPGGSSYVASAGLPFWFLAVRESAVLRAEASLADLVRLTPPEEVRATNLSRLAGVVVFSWPESVTAAHVRVFCPDLGTIEDPATGSAALALSAVLVGSGRLPGTGRASFVVRQGAEIGRPSTLRCELSAESGRVVSSWVGGEVMPVASGRIAIPDPN
jgi:trans-2,3-dihydro-3-hydroxyanthranilate isomerase